MCLASMEPYEADAPPDGDPDRHRWRTRSARRHAQDTGRRHRPCLYRHRVLRRCGGSVSAPTGRTGRAPAAGSRGHSPAARADSRRSLRRSLVIWRAIKTLAARSDESDPLRAVCPKVTPDPAAAKALEQAWQQRRTELAGWKPETGWLVCTRGERRHCADSPTPEASAGRVVDRCRPEVQRARLRTQQHQDTQHRGRTCRDQIVPLRRFGHRRRVQDIFNFGDRPQ